MRDTIWTDRGDNTVWLQLHYRDGAALWIRLDSIESIAEMTLDGTVIGSRIKLATETHEVKETPEQIMKVIKMVGK